MEQDLTAPPVTIQPEGVIPMVSPSSQTVIQVNQTVMPFHPMCPRGPGRPWSTGLCACCDDVGICLCAMFIPCHPCMVAVEMDESCCFPFCAPPGVALLAMRTLIRGRHNIEGNLCNDLCITGCLCTCLCAECQLAREVKNIKSGRAAP